jgi:hypothetical protein
MEDLLTLSQGGRKRRFRADIRAGEYIKVETGRKGNGTSLAWSDYKKMIGLFRGRGFFPLGNGIDALKPGGLGEYFAVSLKKSPRYASHYAAVMVYLKDAKVVRENPLTLRIL